MGLHLAGKLPIVLNWTTGPVNVTHAVTLMGLKTVVTSHAFIDRTHITITGAEFLFLEDVKKSITKWEAILALLQVRYFPNMARRAALKNATTDANAPAVVLFTSGSEKNPKAVPLTHANIIANMRSVLPMLPLTRADAFLGFLPLFHSFGHTITAVFPLLGGVRILHHPDPTDAGGLVKKIAAYRPTFVAGTPTFIGFILDKAKPGDMNSLCTVVLGAEKCPPSLVQRLAVLAPDAKIVEGYGITECSPIVSVNTPYAPRDGTIGKPINDLAVKVVDLETNEPVASGTMGMLLISGPNVFPGYLGDDVPSPFVENDGRRWYVSGDLAALDEAGYIVFHGRLKRFLKAAGEMISLPALEEPFAKRYPPTDTGPRVAVEGRETDHGRQIVLFNTLNLNLRDANKILQEEGFTGVMRLDDVKTLPTIPVLGTGKVDYKALRALLN
jgi:long-chain-fatty-acid--[acyl-carrier-protein] ligase